MMRILNKILIVFAFCIAVVCCSTTKMTREEKRALQIRTAQMVEDSLANGTFRIDVNYMIPNRMNARNLEYGYYIRYMGTLSMLIFHSLARLTVWNTETMKD